MKRTLLLLILVRSVSSWSSRRPVRRRPLRRRVPLPTVSPLSSAPPDNVADAEVAEQVAGRYSDILKNLKKKTAKPPSGFEILDSLTRYSDDGYTLSAPQRYSVMNWYRNFLSIPRSRVLARVRSHLVFNFVWSVVVTALCYVTLPAALCQVMPSSRLFNKLDVYLPFAMSGGILGILLAFRTSQSYQRFWQGRLIWARVVNTVRSFARAISYLDSPDLEYVNTMYRWLKAYPTAFMQHLRGQRSMSDLDTLSPPDLLLMEASDNMPISCILVLTELVNKIKSDEEQSANIMLWWQMESCCRTLMDCVGEGEAIAGTPVPVSYSRHTSRLLSCWTIFCPFVFVQCLPPVLVPFVTVIVSWMLLATEEIGHIIEEPFGIHDDRPNMLPLQRYCDVIQKDVEMMSQENAFMEGVVPEANDYDGNDEAYEGDF